MTTTEITVPEKDELFSDIDITDNSEHAGSFFLDVLDNTLWLAVYIGNNHCMMHQFGNPALYTLPLDGEYKYRRVSKVHIEVLE